MPNQKFKMKKILLTLILGMFLISLASAEIQTLGTFKQEEEINLIQTCASCTFNNITSIIRSPNSTQIIGNVVMTRIGSVYNFTLSSGNTTELGEYIVNGIGDLNGVNTVWNYNFFITQTGFKLTTGNSILIFILMGGVFFIFIFVFWAGITLPFSNERNEAGKIISVGKLKYVKLGMLFLSYALFTWLLNLFLVLSDSFLILSQYVGFFTMVFQILINMVFPLFIIMILSFWFLAWKDLELIKLLERGINPR